ncbi:angiopoietin-related protein 1-like [Anopheles albimanus]|uniref:angiopoietin-related protein 1-like n=1 Tax=Anopheles albimanus TaxID=7167 RepID=UPI0016400F4B|nr:angiopoietin-related protein 1-like [Anopheles albimanus]
MKSTVCFIMVSVALHVGASDPSPCESKEQANSSMNEVLENGLQFLVAKFEAMETMFMEMRLELHEHRQDLTRVQSLQEKTFGDFLWSIHRFEARLDRLDHDVGRNLSVLDKRSWLTLELQTVCASHDQFRDKLFDSVPKQNRSAYKLGRELFNMIYNSKKQDCPIPAPEQNIGMLRQVSVTSTSTTPTIQTTIEPPSFSSCKNVLSNVSGIHQIHIKSEPIKVYCEQEMFGGGWIVIQHRYNGAVDFFRGWNEFRDGFGDLNNEFWLGLEKVHQLTKQSRHELIVELKHFNGTYKYARYDAFEIGNEREQYILRNLGTYSGTAEDNMTYNKGMKFTTNDRDNDLNSSLQCAHYHGGAWWYKSCTNVNLNGLYMSASPKTSMFWNNYNGLSFSRMMIREQ